jgi:hypothetical protein
MIPGTRATRQPRSARVARLHAAGPEGRQGSRRYVPQEPFLRHRHRDHQPRGGRSLVSMLDAKGNPEIVAKSLIAPPMARVGPITDAERQQLMQKNSLLGKYETPIDRQSAFETLRDRSQKEGGADASGPPAGGLLGSIAGALGGLFGKPSGAGRQVDGRNRTSLGGSISRTDRRDQDRPSHFARGPRRQIEIVSAHSVLQGNFIEC